MAMGMDMTRTICVGLCVGRMAMAMARVSADGYAIVLWFWLWVWYRAMGLVMV